MSQPQADGTLSLAAGARRPVGAAGQYRSWGQRMAAHPLALASAGVLAVLTLLVLAEPIVAQALGTDSTAQDLLSRMQPPSAAHPLGTDDLGRDLLLRLLEGGRVSIGIGLVVTLGAAVIGTAVGLLAGYFGGVIDALLMRITDGI